MVNDGTSTINGGYGISRSELTIGHLVTGISISITTTGCNFSGRHMRCGSDLSKIIELENRNSKTGILIWQSANKQLDLYPTTCCFFLAMSTAGFSILSGHCSFFPCWQKI